MRAFLLMVVVLPGCAPGVFGARQLECSAASSIHYAGRSLQLFHAPGDDPDRPGSCWLALTGIAGAEVSDDRDEIVLRRVEDVALALEAAREVPPLRLDWTTAALVQIERDVGDAGPVGAIALSASGEGAASIDADLELTCARCDLQAQGGFANVTLEVGGSEVPLTVLLTDEADAIEIVAPDTEEIRVEAAHPFASITVEAGPSGSVVVGVPVGLDVDLDLDGVAGSVELGSVDDVDGAGAVVEVTTSGAGVVLFHF